MKRQEYEKAAQIVDAAIKESTRSDVLADAWVTKGNVLLAQKQWDAALLAFLRVPVFYRDEKLYMPPALLGSARAYRYLEDKERAGKTLNELTVAFPKSAEAAIARDRIAKIVGTRRRACRPFMKLTILYLAALALITLLLVVSALRRRSPRQPPRRPRQRRAFQNTVGADQGGRLGHDSDRAVLGRDAVSDR